MRPHSALAGPGPSSLFWTVEAFAVTFLILTVFVAVLHIDNKEYLLLVASICPDKTRILYLDHKLKDVSINNTY